MYAPNPDNYTYSSSPEDNDCNDGSSLLSSSFFDRVDALSHARVTSYLSTSPPLMTGSVGGGGGQHEEKMGSMNSTLSGFNNNGKQPSSSFFDQDVGGGGGCAASAAAAAASGFPLGLEGSSMGSIVSNISNIIASHKSLLNNNNIRQQQQQQGDGQLQEQYGYNTPMNPPELLTSGGSTATTNQGTSTSLSSSIDKSSTENGPETSSTSSSIHNNNVGGNKQDEDDAGRRQYQEIMSTPALLTATTTTTTKAENESSMEEMNQQQQQQCWTDSGNSTPVPPVAPASSSSFQPQQKNEGGEDNTNMTSALPPPVSSSSSLNNNTPPTTTTTNNKDNQPMVFHGKGSFPLNLALMLESVEHPWTYDDASVTIPGSEDGKMNHIVSWLPCGSGFVIHRTDLFLSEVLPRFFKSSKNTKLRSFYRKLNRWGFSVLRSSQVNQEGAISSVKNAWQHPDFSRERAVDCLMRAQKSGDTDYSDMLSVTHVSFGGGEGGGSSSNGGRGTPGSSGGGGGGGKKRSARKRNSDYSIESTCSRNTMDMDEDEFNASFPTLDRISNKRRESLQDRMSWTAGAPLPSSLQLNSTSWTMGIGGGSGVGASSVVNNAAATKQLTDLFNQSWTAGINPVPNMTTSSSASSQTTPFQLNQSWTAGRNSLDTSAAQLNQSWKAGSNPLNTSAAQQLNQSWATSGFTPNNASQLSHIQFNQLMNNQVSNSTTTAAADNISNGYNEWKNMVMQSNGQSEGSTFGQEQQKQQQQQTWGNSSSGNVSQLAAYGPQSNTNGNSFNPPAPVSAQVTKSQEQQQQQQWPQLNQHQNQQSQQMNGYQQQQQPQGNGVGRSQQEQEELTQQDEDLRMFFERFAERMGKEDEK